MSQNNRNPDRFSLGAFINPPPDPGEQLQRIEEKLDKLLATLAAPNSIIILRHPDIDRIAAQLKGKP